MDLPWAKYKVTIMQYKDFVPPVILSLANKAIGFYSGRKYESYNQAKKYCSPEAYEDPELCNMIADKTIRLKNQQNEMPYEVKASSAFLLSAFWKTITLSHKESISILDVGGACGAHYYSTRHLLPENIQIKWFILETEQIVKSAESRNLGNHELVFMSSLENFKYEIDIVHSSCTLHYVPEPYSLLKTITELNAKAILLNRMMFNINAHEFITVQKSFMSDNGQGPMPEGYRDKIIKYPHTTLSISKVNSFLSDRGYQRKWIFEENSGILPIRNEKIIGRGLLYIKHSCK